MTRNRTVDQSTLESMVDTYGVNGVLSLLASVCEDKAEHVQHAWQDEKMAKAWDRLSDKLCAFADSSVPPFAKGFHP